EATQPPRTETETDCPDSPPDPPAHAAQDVRQACEPHRIRHSGVPHLHRRTRRARPHHRLTREKRNSATGPDRCRRPGPPLAPNPNPSQIGDGILTIIPSPAPVQGAHADALRADGYHV